MTNSGKQTCFSKTTFRGIFLNIALMEFMRKSLAVPNSEEVPNSLCTLSQMMIDTLAKDYPNDRGPAHQYWYRKVCI